MELINNPMTTEGKKALFEEYHRVLDSGMSDDDALSVVKKFPLDPALALAIKDVFGIEYLEGYNLAEAIETYGKEQFTS